MPRFDLNISILLREVPFLERFERAASLGSGGLELKIFLLLQNGCVLQGLLLL
jgi:hydroxypyruvate isomerase